MVLTPANGQMCLGTSPVVLEFLYVFSHFVARNCLFMQSNHSHFDMGK